MSTRREFLQQAGLAAGLLPLTNSLAQKLVDKGELIKISILHTNDVHSHIDAFDENHKRYAGKGGVENRFRLIKQLRKENPNTLLFDCGDIFQGTPYFNMYGGELELKLMSKMAYDAATMGNHDFDNGMEGFLKVKPFAKFPFICSNYDFSETILKNQTLPFKIFHRNGIKIGVFGLGIELKGLVSSSLFGKTKYLDPIKIAQEQVILFKQKYMCDLIVCLSHLGYKYDGKKVSDRELAAKTSGIDLILGGHTHTFLEKAERIKNKNGGTTLVNQVGWAGLNLGKVDFYFNKNRKKSVILHGNQANFLEIK